MTWGSTISIASFLIAKDTPEEGLGCAELEAGLLLTCASHAYIDTNQQCCHCSDHIC
jgi:hypothetical protein